MIYIFLKIKLWEYEVRCILIFFQFKEWTIVKRVKILFFEVKHDAVNIEFHENFHILKNVYLIFFGESIIFVCLLIFEHFSQNCEHVLS